MRLGRKRLCLEQTPPRKEESGLLRPPCVVESLTDDDKKTVCPTTKDCLSVWYTACSRFPFAPLPPFHLNERMRQVQVCVEQTWTFESQAAPSSVSWAGARGRDAYYLGNHVAERLGPSSLYLTCPTLAI